ncbi:MAG: MarR family transcriptional regulator [Lewinellaceae bacterium]|nr:MarR family transcriptional regulator [Lewinellaceae bacterium]
MRIEEEIKTSKFQNEYHKVNLNILFTAGWLKGNIAHSLKPFDITSEQYNVMRIVRGQSPKSVCVKDITHRMLDRNSNTTRIIDRLEGKNLLQRITSDRDRRERSIQLTPAGFDLLSAIDHAWEKNAPHAAGSLNLEEAKELNHLLDKLRG